MSDDRRHHDDHDDDRDLRALAQAMTVADLHLDTPPPDVWAGIQARVAAGEPPSADDRAGEDRRVLGVDHAGARATRPGRRARRLPVVLGTAAAVVVAIIGLVVAVRDERLSGTRVGEVALSNEGLEPVGSASRGRATLVQLAGGDYALDLEVTDLPRVDGFFELWLIDTGVQGMYSLGPVARSGRYPLPRHVDPSRFPIVDVSVEPTDGQPAHSGHSLLRGKLTI